ncbi:MAG: hypothetical protein KBC17_04125 [Candidatus Pacebacteria bacterium]|nr:hypothetical protein [Candidatus Paceibacterota bacterium]
MKKIIFSLALSLRAATFCYGQDSVAVETSLPNSIGEVAGIVKTDGKIDLGYLNLKSNPIRKNVSLTTILFVESDFAKKTVDVSAGIGGGLHNDFVSAGVLVGWANNPNMLSLTFYAYGENKSRTLSGFFFLTKEGDRIIYVFEALKCFNVGKDTKIGISLVNFKEYLGVGFRVSVGDRYFAIAPSVRCLPEINLGHSTGKVEGGMMHHGGAELPRFGIQFIYGTEKNNRCSLPDCNTL